MGIRHRTAGLAIETLMAAAIAGCGSPSAPSAAGTASATGPAGSVMTSAAPQPSWGGTATAGTISPGLTVRVTVRGREVTPAPAKVPVGIGQPVTLVVTSDRSTVLHLHGVEIERPVTAGVPTTVVFVAPHAGVFEVELHDPELRLLDFVAR